MAENTGNGKPSFMTSTFSIMALIIVTGFVIICIWMKDVGSLKEVAMSILGAYTYKKASELNNKNGNGAKKNEPAS